MIMTYEVAMEKLEHLARELESGSVAIDDMAEKLRSAESLIKFCKEKLQNVEEKINKIVESAE